MGSEERQWDDDQGEDRGGDDSEGDCVLALGDPERDEEGERRPRGGLADQEGGEDREPAAPGEKAAGEEARGEAEDRRE